jgi:uncharacterized protein YaeQ
MALKATIHKATLQIADMDRHVYADHAITIARHPSETDERMMMRLLAFALCVPATDANGTLDFAKGLWDTDEPDLWQRDYTGDIVQWIEVGQPDERRLLKACGRAQTVAAFAYSGGARLWWESVASKLVRTRNLRVWQIDASQSQALALLVQRTMQLQVTIQEGTVWIGNGADPVEVTPRRLMG